MLIAINVLGILVFVGVAYLFSNDKKNIQWKSVSIVLVLEVFLAWFFSLVLYPIQSRTNCRPRSSRWL